MSLKYGNIITVTNNTGTLNVKSYGAIGDGSSHPASTVYGTLAALQAVYGTTISGVTVALTQELDWLGTQKAIDTAAVTGGAITSVGSFRYTNANSVTDGSGTLTFPTADYYGLVGSVSWLGILGNSFHSWPNDLGSGRFAVLCAGRVSNSSAGYFEQLNLTGPGIGSTLGATTTSMHGIGSNARRNFNQVHVNSFKVGINIVGDQSLWQDVLVNNCYYGLYYDTPNSAAFGNFVFIRVVADTCLMAAVGVHHAATLLGVAYHGAFFGRSPYGIYKETNAGTPTMECATYECLFDNCQFEGIGNAMIGDDRSAPANRKVVVFNTVFNYPQFSWDATKKLAAVNAYGILDISRAEGLSIQGIVSGGTWLPGTVATFSVQYAGAFILNCDTAWLFSNCIAASGGRTNALVEGNHNYKSYIITSSQGTNSPWTGRVGYAPSAVSVGQIVVANGTGPGYISAAAGTTTEVPVGVVMYVPGAGNGWCVIAETGIVNIITSGTVTAGLLVRTTTSGAGITTGTNSIVGVAMDNTATNRWNICLRGLV